MPQQAMTVSPEYSETGELMDFNVHHNSQHFQHTDRSGVVYGNENDYVENNNGETIHRYSNVTQPEDQKQFDFDQYLYDWTKADPQYAFAAYHFLQNPEQFNPQLVEDFKNAAQTGDLDRFHEIAEIFVEHYDGEVQEINYETEQPEQSDDLQEWFESVATQEQLDQQVTNLTNLELTPEIGSDLVDAASYFDQNSIEHEMLRGAVDVAFGKNDMTQLIDYFVDQYGDAQTYASYMNVLNVISEHF